jgi:hypothetical protein
MTRTRNSYAPLADLQFSLRSLLAFITVLSIPLGILAFIYHRSVQREAELARLAKVDAATVLAIVEDVEAVHAKLGRAPKDQEELESHLGKQMPHVHDHGYPTPIMYWRTGENSFILQYELWDTDDWIYDSRQPNSGWVQHYF